MITLSGKAVSGGIAFGRVSVFKKDETTVKRRHISDADAEIARFEEAKAVCAGELELLFYKATREIGEAEASIFEIHRMMIDDMDYNESILNIISKQHVNAETAVLMTSDTFSGMFSDRKSVV